MLWVFLEKAWANLAAVPPALPTKAGRSSLYVSSAVACVTELVALFLTWPLVPTAFGPRGESSPGFIGVVWLVKGDVVSSLCDLLRQAGESQGLLHCGSRLS